MLDLLGMIAALNRPRLLVSAARFGVEEYARGAELPRLLKCAGPPRTGEAIVRLLDLEAGLEARRIVGAADYAVARHVAVLAALLGEARILRAAYRSAFAPEAALADLAAFAPRPAPAPQPVA